MDQTTSDSNAKLARCRKETDLALCMAHICALLSNVSRPPHTIGKQRWSSSSIDVTVGLTSVLHVKQECWMGEVITASVAGQG